MTVASRPTKRHYAIGPMALAVVGDGPISERLHADFRAWKTEQELAPDLLVTETEGESELLGRSESESTYLSGRGLRVRKSGYTEQTGALCTRVDFSTERVAITVAVRRDRVQQGKALLRSGSTVFAGIDAFFSYSRFWSLLHLALLKRDMAFLHSGVLDRDGSGIALIGTGGSGKTSLTLELVSSHGFKYLSEDFGIIAQNGSAFFSPRRLSVYRSDYQRVSPELRARFDRLLRSDPVNRVAWELYRVGGGNPVRRIRPEDLLGADKLGRTASLRTVFLLRRGETDRPSAETLTISEAVNRCLAASFRELQPLYEPYYQSGAIIGEGLPDMSSAWSKSRIVYEGALSEVRAHLLTLPKTVNTSETIDVVLDRIV